MVLHDGVIDLSEMEDLMTDNDVRWNKITGMKVGDPIPEALFRRVYAMKVLMVLTRIDGKRLQWKTTQRVSV